MRRLIVPILVVFSLAAAGASSKIPNLTLPDPAGKPSVIDFSAGSVTLVNFWATWCMPCREEMPEIVNLLGKYKEKGLRAVGIALESGEPAEIKAFLEENRALGITYPILVGDEKTPGQFGSVEMVPTTYLVDAKGLIVKRYIGVSRGFGERVGADIRELLKGTASPKGEKPAGQ